MVSDLEQSSKLNVIDRLHLQSNRSHVSIVYEINAGALILKKESNRGLHRATMGPLSYIVKDYFPKRTGPSTFVSIAAEFSRIKLFPVLNLTKHFLLQFTVSLRSDSIS